MSSRATQKETVLPWGGIRARVFGQVVRAAVQSPGVLQAELGVDAPLLATHGEASALIVVAHQGRREGAPRSELTALGSPRSWPRVQRSTPARPFGPAKPTDELSRIGLPVKVGKALIGELRLWHKDLSSRDLRQITLRAESALEVDLLKRRVAFDRTRAKALLETAPDPVLIVDARSGRVLAANRRAASMFHRREHDLPQLELQELFETTDRATPLEALRKRPRGARLIWTVRRRGAEAISVAVSASRSTGHSPQWHLVVRDVSHEESARRALLRAKDTLAAIAVAGAQLQAETERSAIFDAVGRELAGLGYFSAVLLPEPTPSDGSRTPLWSVAHIAVPLGGPEPPNALRSVRFDPNQFPPLQRALSQHRPIFSWSQDRFHAQGTKPPPRRGRKPDGTLWTPLTAQGAAFGALWVAGPDLRPADAEGIAAFALQVGMALERARLYAALMRRSHDLEGEVERRTRELTLAVRALREVDRRKDNFMANVSHELRTPLVTILGYTQLVLSGRMGDLTDSQRLSLATAMRNGTKLKDFIDELLDYSRHELTRESLHRETFSVRRVLEQAAAAIYPKLLERGLLLQTRVAAGTPDVYAEPERILQVLNNLLTNAERHCHPGGRLWIAAAGNAERVKISVSDNGDGIAPEHRDRIFDRLYQVGDKAVAREKGAGLGLGLAIAKSIVEAHGGRIWIDTRRKTGTRFCFELPAATLLAEQSAEKGAATEV